MRISILSFLALAFVVCNSGCTTATRRYAEGEVRQTVAGFSEADISDTVSRAAGAINRVAGLKVQKDVNRSVVIVEDLTCDTLNRGRDAGALAEALSVSLREELTGGGRIVVYHERTAQYAPVKILPQYRLAGRLTERNLRQDNGDFQKEYNLNLTLVDLETGLEIWQKRVHVGKEVDKQNVMN